MSVRSEYKFVPVSRGVSRWSIDESRLGGASLRRSLVKNDRWFEMMVTNNGNGYKQVRINGPFRWDRVDLFVVNGAVVVREGSTWKYTYPIGYRISWDVFRGNLVHGGAIELLRRLESGEVIGGFVFGDEVIFI